MDGDGGATAVEAGEEDGCEGGGHGGLDDEDLAELGGHGYEFRAEEDEGWGEDDADEYGAGDDFPGRFFRADEIDDGGAGHEDGDGECTDADHGDGGAEGAGDFIIDAEDDEDEADEDGDDGAVDEAAPVDAAFAADDHDADGPDGDFDADVVDEEDGDGGSAPEDFDDGDGGEAEVLAA